MFIILRGRQEVCENENIHHNMHPIIALIIANIIWGMASPIFKFALTNVPPFTLAFARFFFAGLLFLPMVIRRWEHMSLRDIGETMAGAFFGITLNISFFFLGIQKTESINAPIIASAGPVFLFFFSVLFLKEKPVIRIFFGMLIALLGVVVIIISPLVFSSSTFALGALEGNIFLVIATIGSIFYPLFQKNVLRRISPLQITCLSFLISSITFLPPAIPEWKSWSISQLNVAGWTGILFGVFFSSALAYGLYAFGVSKIKVQEVGLFTYIDPVAALLVAAPLLGEYPTIWFFIGSFLVFFGILIAEKRIHYHPIYIVRKKTI